MGIFFSKNYSGDLFVLFGALHLLVMAGVVVACLCVYLLRRRFNERGRRLMRYGLSIFIIMAESSWHVWMLWIGDWNIQGMLPLWLCSMMAWLSPVLLISRNHRLYEFAYFMGLIGPAMAILTPDLGQYGFPHFRFIEFFLLHGAIMVGVVYMTAIEGLRPTWRSIPRVVVIMNVYWAFTAIVNALIGSNYLYTAGKLTTPSLLDYLGPHPWYLLSMEAVAIGLMVLLYLPFAVRDARVERAELI
jgi:hypothetical integral membrane protein (TIGR02206 family)